MSETEQEEPAYAAMITGYKVEQNRLHDTPYYGLKAYETHKGPIDHFVGQKDCKEYLNSYSLLGRRCFQQSFEFITL